MLTNSRDVIEQIYNSNGALQCRYIYDSWGNTVRIVDSNNNDITNSNHIGHINPIRYRGYYYDKESRLYYLNSRYYDSEVSRFINAGDIAVVSLEPSSLYDKNLYAYCDNNPVSRIDENGDLWGTIVAGALFNVTFNWLASLMTGEEFGFADVLITGITGALGASVNFKLAATFVDSAYVFCKSMNVTKENPDIIKGVLDVGVNLAFSYLCLDTVGEKLSNKDLTDLSYKKVSAILRGVDTLLAVPVTSTIDKAYFTGYYPKYREKTRRLYYVRSGRI